MPLLLVLQSCAGPRWAQPLSPDVVHDVMVGAISKLREYPLLQVDSYEFVPKGQRLSLADGHLEVRWPIASDQELKVLKNQLVRLYAILSKAKEVGLPVISLSCDPNENLGIEDGHLSIPLVDTSASSDAHETASKPEPAEQKCAPAPTESYEPQGPPLPPEWDSRSATHELEPLEPGASG